MLQTTAENEEAEGETHGVVGKKFKGPYTRTKDISFGELPAEHRFTRLAA